MKERRKEGTEGKKERRTGSTINGEREGKKEDDGEKER